MVADADADFNASACSVVDWNIPDLYHVHMYNAKDMKVGVLRYSTAMRTKVGITAGCLR